MAVCAPAHDDDTKSVLKGVKCLHPHDALNRDETEMQSHCLCDLNQLKYFHHL